MVIKKHDMSFEEYLDKVFLDISSKHFTKEEADHYSEAIIDTIEEEYNLFGAEGIPKMAKKHIVEKISNVFDALLSRGLDVNSDSDENALMSCIWIENKDIAIMLAKKFLEHGADPNLRLTCEGGESLYEYMIAGIYYDRFNDEGYIKIWLLLNAYGGVISNGCTYLEMINDNSVKIFKNIDNYGVRTVYKRGEFRELQFYNITTNEDVAIL